MQRQRGTEHELTINLLDGPAQPGWLGWDCRYRHTGESEVGHRLGERVSDHALMIPCVRLPGKRSMAGTAKNDHSRPDG
jgi:hypothetical protein